MKTPVRSVSGVTPLTVVLPPRKCNHGTCIYCPGGEKVPQSYTDKSPAVMRAMTLKFDPYKQVKTRLTALEKMGHPTNKLELIIIGGTFLQYSTKFQYQFIKRCFDSLNGKTVKSFVNAKKLNETSKNRCVAMCIETRPDNCSPKDIKRMLEFGCTRVEIGVQILDDRIYKKINRGHSVSDVVFATKNLKDAGFKVGYHIMPGLPFSDPKNDLAKFKLVFSDERFRPDQLKIYPCQVIDDSPLAKLHKKINYTPYTSEQMFALLSKMFLIIPRYCRVMRIMREIPKEKMLSEIIRLDLRKDVERELRDNGIHLKEIRMREIGFNQENLNLDLKMKITKYRTSDGKEYFLEIVNRDDILFGLLRLRIFENGSQTTTHDLVSLQSRSKINKKLNSSIPIEDLAINSSKDFLGAIATSNFARQNYKINNERGCEKSNLTNQKCAIIRELHVYGQTLNLGDKSDLAAQHKGIGRWLIAETEKIVRENKIKKLKIISGAGAREYYRKLRYDLDIDGIYMEKVIA